MLLVRILIFVLGGAVAVAMHQFKFSTFWSLLSGIVVYVVVDLIVERMIFGVVG